MIEVVDSQTFKALAARVDRVEAENEFLKSLLSRERWLSREQTMTALNCSKDTLLRLRRANLLTVRYEGDRPYYDVFDIRTYLTAKNIDAAEADKRILSARLAA